jgi:hypothetical protein
MRLRFLNSVSVVLLAVLATLLTAGAAVAGPEDEDQDAKTEDILFMVDGRELHGRIVEETRDAVVFHLVDRASGLEATVTYPLGEIARIERDVALPEETAEESDEPEETWTVGKQESEAGEAPERTYGSLQGDPDDESLPSFYIVPMKGQMGTDINESIYREMVDDIRRQDPDYLLIEMECRDFEEPRTLASLAFDPDERGLSGSDFLDMYRELVSLFHDELHDIPQVLWIDDSVGISSVIALSWKNMYMKPEARFGGISGERAFFEMSDFEKQAKYREAYLGWLKGFVEYGGYALELIDAMVLPQEQLSATWKGREVIWSLDTNGEYVVDSSDEQSANFYAKDAEDLCLTKGTAENLDDLALLLGIREYRVLRGDGEQLFEDYRKDWRRLLDNCRTWWEDYSKYMSWAGDNPVAYLGKAKRAVERILAATKRYKAVEIRVMMELGLTQFDLETIIEQLEIQIRRLRQGQGAGGGGRGGSGGGGGAGRRGPGGPGGR